MTKELLSKARQRRHIALREARMPHLNIFWDGRPRPGSRHTVIAQLSDLRIRMGRKREPLVSGLV